MNFSSKSIILFSCFFMFAVGIKAQGSKSVVRVKADGKQGTGFVFNSPRQVVTALHVVAGSNSILIESESTGESSTATIYKVHLESDLALLVLDKQLGVLPLIHTAQPNTNAEHTIWGYPRNVKTKQGDHIRFSKSENSNPTLDDIFKPGDKIASDFERQGYPLRSMNILRVSSIIQPGHSGAPILNDSNLVVGIGDGGLNDGFARINWAIHAKYLPKLITEGIDKTNPNFPGVASNQKQLMGSQVDSNIPTEVKTFANGKELLFIRTQRLGDIYDNLKGKEQENIDSQSQYFEANWRDFYIDVYEDYDTGATVATPHNSTITYDPVNDWFSIKPNNKLEMVFQISSRNTWESAMQTKDLFYKNLGQTRAWAESPNSTYENSYPEYSFYNGGKSWEILDNQGTQNGLMDAVFNVDNGNFFGTAYMTHDVQNHNNDNYYLLNICAKLSRFVGH